jgi:phosphopyruvate hydratase
MAGTSRLELTPLELTPLELTPLELTPLELTPLELTRVHAVEILDSRGGPTLAVTVTLAECTVARAGVPSGASTGSREAVELRDGDKSRYGGKGVLTAVGNVNGEIADALVGRSFADPAEVDQAMRDLDGTPNKGRLGANGIIGVSIATYRASAASAGIPLWTSLIPTGVTPCQPVPHFNVVNGGAHAPNSLDFQEFLIAPLGAPSIAEAIRAGAQVYAKLKGCCTTPATPPAWATRAGSPRTSAPPRMCCARWCRPSPTPDTPRVGMVSRSRWTRLQRVLS